MKRWQAFITKAVQVLKDVIAVEEQRKRDLLRSERRLSADDYNITVSSFEIFGNTFFKMTVENQHTGQEFKCNIGFYTEKEAVDFARGTFIPDVIKKGVRAEYYYSIEDEEDSL